MFTCRKTVFVALALAFAVAGCNAALQRVLDARASLVRATDIDLVRLLPPPPAADSPETRAELDQLLALQAQRTPAAAERARADDEASVFRFADVFDAPAAFTPARLPWTRALFSQLRDDELAAVKRAKDIFARVRPCRAEPRVAPVIRCPGTRAYPSGHATLGWIDGLVLADMLPEKRAQILARAREYGWNRVVAGVHYPSDIEAGRASATAIVALLFASPEFRAREAQAREELRPALGFQTKPADP
ncbi:MAG: phosphatase PAP2 family protein [Steroidobacteraceae bacterium]